MNDIEVKAGADHVSDPWSQIQPLIGADHLQRMSPENLAGFKRLLIEATGEGNDGEGPVRELFGLLGSRWSGLILQLAHYGPFRFSTLQRIIQVIDRAGISRRMLALKLHAFERDGMILRSVSGSAPMHVEYSLTPLGAQFRDRVMSMVIWLAEHAGDIEAARRAYEERETADI
jgi:DNA-binding HxlR family transcriptional regulator